MILIQEFDRCLQTAGLFHGVLMAEKCSLDIVGGVFDRRLSATWREYIIAIISLDSVAREKVLNVFRQV